MEVSLEAACRGISVNGWHVVGHHKNRANEFMNIIRICASMTRGRACVAAAAAGAGARMVLTERWRSGDAGCAAGAGAWASGKRCCRAAGCEEKGGWVE